MTDCLHIPELSYSEFGKRLHEKVKDRRVPLVGSLELTFRCNLRCVHCYVAHGRDEVSAQEELSHPEICGILDQVAEEGCLWFLLTGGEPLLRPDFLDIYTYAKRKGFLISLFTNGTPLTPRIADALAEYPPFKVEITLYGRTQETYERITGVPGSYGRCMRGIELLLERGVRLKLKTMLMTLNRHELRDMQAYAESAGVDFYFDPMINAGVEGSKVPVTYRLSPEEVVRFDLSDPKRAADWRSLHERSQHIDVNPHHLYSCGAGLSSFHIDPYGRLSVCLLSREPQYELRHGSFREGWQVHLERTRFQPSRDCYECNQCALLSLCGQCPGWGKSEHGDPEKEVEFLCQVAHLRAEALDLNAHQNTTP